MKNRMVRYLILADGVVIDWHYNKTKAWIKACNYAEQWSNQDEPFFPKMELIEEEIE